MLFTLDMKLNKYSKNNVPVDKQYHRADDEIEHICKSCNLFKNKEIFLNLISKISSGKDKIAKNKKQRTDKMA